MQIEVTEKEARSIFYNRYFRDNNRKYMAGLYGTGIAWLGLSIILSRFMVGWQQTALMILLSVPMFYWVFAMMHKAKKYAETEYLKAKS